MDNQDDVSNANRLRQIEPQPAYFIGLPKNEDAVTKLLMSK